MSDVIQQTIKTKIMYAYHNAQYAHETIFNEKLDKSIAIGYLTLCASYYNAAQAVYAANYEMLGREDLDDLLFEFHAFVKEAMNNYRTDHSHQWSDIHFQRLTEKYNSSASVLGIVLN
jgi:hypothetical protein